MDTGEHGELDITLGHGRAQLIQHLREVCVTIFCLKRGGYGRFQTLLTRACKNSLANGKPNCFRHQRRHLHLQGATGLSSRKGPLNSPMAELLIESLSAVFPTALSMKLLVL